MDFDPRVEFVGHVWQTLDDERRVQGLTMTNIADRMGTRRNRMQRDRLMQRDIRLSQVARLAHAMGKRVKIVLEDEVAE